eukprot:3492840-Rhodomonas_salina.1
MGLRGRGYAPMCGSTLANSSTRQAMQLRGQGLCCYPVAPSQWQYQGGYGPRGPGLWGYDLEALYVVHVGSNNVQHGLLVPESRAYPPQNLRGVGFRV